MNILNQIWAYIVFVFAIVIAFFFNFFKQIGFGLAAFGYSLYLIYEYVNKIYREYIVAYTYRIYGQKYLYFKIPVTTSYESLKKLVNDFKGFSKLSDDNVLIISYDGYSQWTLREEADVDIRDYEVLVVYKKNKAFTLINKRLVENSKDIFLTFRRVCLTHIN